MSKKEKFQEKMNMCFKGDGPKSEVEEAKDCRFYQAFAYASKEKEENGDPVIKKACSALDRENCLGCSFYKKEVTA